VIGMLPLVSTLHVGGFVEPSQPMSQLIGQSVVQ